MKTKALILTLLMAAACAANAAENGPAAKPAAAPAQEMVTLNFPNTSLDLIIQYYAQLTGRTAIYQSTLSGRIVLQSNGPLTKEDAIRALENALSVNGFSVIPQGEKFFKVVPNQTAKQEGVPFHSGPDGSADRLVTQIITLRYADVQSAIQSLQPLIHSYGQLVAFARTNSLLVTDTAANIQQFKRLIESIDQPIEARVQTKFYQLKNARAKEVLTQLQSLVQASQPAGGPAPAFAGRPPGATPPAAAAAAAGELTLNEDSIVVGKVSLSADERTNQIIVLTRTINLPFFDQIISKLDINTAATMVIRSIALKYAKADQTASLLAQITGGPSGSAGASNDGRVSIKTDTDPYRAPTPAAPPIAAASVLGGGSKSPGASEFGMLSKAGVFADIRTNSILLVGSPDEIRPLEELINEIDVLLAQVLIEGAIMEVTLSNERTFGIEVVRNALDHAGVSANVTIDPIDLATTAIPAASTLGKGLTYLANIQNGAKLEIAVQALARDENVSILSRPLIQTSHNEEARLFVGETRPYITGTVSDIVGTTSTAVRSQYESKEIGLELDIKPLINPDGLVVMDIAQKIETVTGSQVIDGNEIPIVAKREASSVVSIKDGSMVILGGLTQDERSRVRSGIPVLRDIPILGYLFQGIRSLPRKTELMVLLQPTVLRTPEQAAKEAIDRRNQSRKLLMLKHDVEKERKKEAEGEPLKNLFQDKPNLEEPGSSATPEKKP